MKVAYVVMSHHKGNTFISYYAALETRGIGLPGVFVGVVLYKVHVVVACCVCKHLYAIEHIFECPLVQIYHV